MKSQIKAQLVTYNDDGDETKKRKFLYCWVTWNEAIPVVEVSLEDKEGNHQSVYVDFESLMKEVKKHEASK